MSVTTQDNDSKRRGGAGAGAGAVDAALEALRELKADPSRLSVDFPFPPPSDATVQLWLPHVLSGTFGRAPRRTATADGAKRKRTADSAVVSVKPELEPRPRLVGVLELLRKYSATIRSIEIRAGGMTPNALALLCAALSGIDRANATAYAAAYAAACSAAPSPSPVTCEAAGGNLHSLSFTGTAFAAVAAPRRPTRRREATLVRGTSRSFCVPTRRSGT